MDTGRSINLDSGFDNGACVAGSNNCQTNKILSSLLVDLSTNPQDSPQYEEPICITVN